MGWNKGNEVCTERDCSLVHLLGEGGKHYRYQCGSDHVEGYGNTDSELEFEEKQKSKSTNRWGKLRDSMSGGWN